MERFASVAVSASSVVLAVAHQRAFGTGRYAPRSVPVALAPAAHGQIGHRVMVRATGGRGHGRGHRHGRGLLGFVPLQLLVRVQHQQIGTGLIAVQMVHVIRFDRIQVHVVRIALGRGRGGRGGRGRGRGQRRVGDGRGGREMQPVEYDLDVGGRHPVLEHGAIIEVDGTGTALERAERDPRGRRPGAVEPVRVGAQGLLFVGLGDYGPVGPAVHLATLARVELERLPRLAVVHALVDGNRVRFGRLRAELQVDVRQLVLLAQRQRERHVVGRRQRGRRVHRLGGQRLRAPARRVVRVVGVGQVFGRVPAPGLRVVAHVTHAQRRGAQLAVPFGTADAARAGRLHVVFVRRVHEVGYATPGPSAVVTRVGRVNVYDGRAARDRAEKEAQNNTVIIIVTRHRDQYYYC